MPQEIKMSNRKRKIEINYLYINKYRSCHNMPFNKQGMCIQTHQLKNNKQYLNRYKKTTKNLLRKT